MSQTYCVVTTGDEARLAYAEMPASARIEPANLASGQPGLMIRGLTYDQAASLTAKLSRFGLTAFTMVDQLAPDMGDSLLGEIGTPYAPRPAAATLGELGVPDAQHIDCSATMNGDASQHGGTGIPPVSEEVVPHSPQTSQPPPPPAAGPFPPYAEVLREPLPSERAAAAKSRVATPHYPADLVILETARLGDSALDVDDLRNALGGRLGACRIPYDSILFIASAQVRTEKRAYTPLDETIERHRREIQERSEYAPMHPIADALREEALTRTITDITHYLDIFTAGPRPHVRLNAGTFNFTQTGLPLRLTSYENLVEFATHFVPLCEQAVIDGGLQQLLDDDPKTALRFTSLQQYDEYLAWRFQAVRKAGS